EINSVAILGDLIDNPPTNRSIPQQHCNHPEASGADENHQTKIGYLQPANRRDLALHDQRGGANPEQKRGEATENPIVPPPRGHPVHIQQPPLKPASSNSDTCCEIDRILWCKDCLDFKWTITDPLPWRVDCRQWEISHR